MTETVDTEDDITDAEILYGAYSEFMNCKGHHVPSFEELSTDERDAYAHAAIELLDVYETDEDTDDLPDAADKAAR